METFFIVLASIGGVFALSCAFAVLIAHVFFGKEKEKEKEKIEKPLRVNKPGLYVVQSNCGQSSPPEGTPLEIVQVFYQDGDIRVRDCRNGIFNIDPLKHFTFLRPWDGQELMK